MSYQQGYGQQAGSYPQGYPPQQGGYDQGYGGSQGGYPQGYPPQQGGGYGGSQGGYGGSQGGYGGGMQAGGSIPNWAQTYSHQSNAGMYRGFFEQGDFQRTGYLDQNGLRAALTAAGEMEVVNDPETVQMMTMMFDEDGNGRIDFNEFNTMMNYVQSTKQTYYANAAANGGAGVTSRDIDAFAYNTHGQFMNDVGGQDVMQRGILPQINPTASGFFSLGNIIKIAIILAILHTLYTKGKLPFFNKNQGQVGSGASYNQSTYGQSSYGSQPAAYNQSASGKQHTGIMGRIMGAFKH